MSYRSVRPAVSLLLLALVATGCTGDDDADITVGTVTKATVVEVVEAPATVVARAAATVTAPAPGSVGELRVHDGDRVRKGQILLVVDSPQTEDQLDLARDAYREAQRSGVGGIPPADFSRTQAATDRAARKAFDQARDAAKKIPDPALRDAFLAQIEQSEQAYAAVTADARQAVSQFNAGLASVSQALGSLSAAQRAQAKAALDLARRQVAALTVRAPISGTVSLAPTGAGQPAGDLSALFGQLPPEAAGLVGSGAATGAGGTTGSSGAGVDTTTYQGMPVGTGSPLVSIIDVSELSLAAEVDETDVLLVEPGVQADVELDAVPGGVYPAVVDSVSLAPTTSTRGGVSYVVRLSLDPGRMADDSAAPAPRPGMSAVADLRVRTAVDAIAVPAAAIVRDGLRDTVWVVDNGRARRRTVTLGAQGEASVQVLNGLALGDQIVVSGADQVTEGKRLP
ncbi:MAG: efflux RND transporter periplasmic adaptor subunit [Sporichthyaceae bacterium]|nr:efflux RND transporter periplasmic adaptor subunit [Sporichthyaceae bacterium]